MENEEKKQDIVFIYIYSDTAVLSAFVTTTP